MLAGAHEAQLTDDRERGLVPGSYGRDEVADALCSSPDDEPFHRLGRVALTSIFRPNPIADLQGVGRRGGVDPRLSVEPGVPDHQAPPLPPNHGPRQPLLDVRVLPELSDPVAEEPLERRVD